MAEITAINTRLGQADGRRALVDRLAARAAARGAALGRALDKLRREQVAVDEIRTLLASGDSLSARVAARADRAGATLDLARQRTAALARSAESVQRHVAAGMQFVAAVHNVIAEQHAKGGEMTEELRAARDRLDAVVADNHATSAAIASQLHVAEERQAMMRRMSQMGLTAATATEDKQRELHEARTRAATVGNEIAAQRGAAHDRKQAALEALAAARARASDAVAMQQAAAASRDTAAAAATDAQAVLDRKRVQAHIAAADAHAERHATAAVNEQGALVQTLLAALLEHQHAVATAAADEAVLHQRATAARSQVAEVLNRADESACAAERARAQGTATRAAADRLEAVIAAAAAAACPIVDAALVACDAMMAVAAECAVPAPTDLVAAVHRVATLRKVVADQCTAASSSAPAAAPRLQVAGAVLRDMQQLHECVMTAHAAVKAFGDGQVASALVGSHEALADQRSRLHAITLQVRARTCPCTSTLLSPLQPPKRRWRTSCRCAQMHAQMPTARRQPLPPWQLTSTASGRPWLRSCGWRRRK